MKAFEDEGWQPTADWILSPKSETEKYFWPLEDCPIPSKTLSGWLRVGVAQPQEERQTWMSHNWLSPTAETWPPESLSGARPPAMCAQSDGSRMVQQEDVALDERDRARARRVWQDFHRQFLSAWREKWHRLMETPLSHQSDILPDDVHPRPVSTLAIFPTTHPTVTVNFLSDGTRPFAGPKSKAPKSFPYLSYRGVPTSLSVGLLIRRLRSKNMGMRGVTEFSEEKRKGHCVWCAGESFENGTKAAGQTLAELGWGYSVDPVWLAVWAWEQ